MKNGVFSLSRGGEWGKMEVPYKKGKGSLYPVQDPDRRDR